MTCCSHCEDAGDLFNSRAARRDLRRYRLRGPSKTTRMLLDSLLAQWQGDETLLDVGGGVGAISHELMGAGYTRAVQVDASAAYLGAAEEEATRQGHRERVTFHYGDFVELAPSLPPADVVTLDRVICCYPHLEQLVTASVEKSRHLYGLVIPRERALVRLGVTFSNLTFRLRGSAFRTYLHPIEAIEALIRQHGFRRTSVAHSILWQIATYARD